MMTNAMCLFFRSSLRIPRSGLLKICNFQRTPYKTLFSEETLRITAFSQSRKNFIVENIEKFQREMENKCTEDSTQLIFFEDLQKMLKTVQSSDDLMLLIKLVKKFNTQNNVVRFGSFSFGPEIMRLLYLLNKPNEALELVKDKELSEVFNQLSSLTILGDLLFENKMYNEVIEFFHLVKDKQLQGKRFPSNLVILFFATCYKLNTSESFEVALNEWNLFLEVGYRSPIRGILFFAALALNQNKSDFALSLVKSIKASQCMISLNIEAMALCYEKEYEKVVELLNKLLFDDRPIYQGSRFITADTLDCMKKSFESSTEEHIKKSEKIIKELIAHKFVKNETLDFFLLEEISIDFKKNNNINHKVSKYVRT